MMGLLTRRPRPSPFAEGLLPTFPGVHLHASHTAITLETSVRFPFLLSPPVPLPLLRRVRRLYAPGLSGSHDLTQRVPSFLSPSILPDYNPFASTGQDTLQ